MVLKVIDNMLSVQGHTVLRCREGRECLKTYQEELRNGTPVDLIIVDLTVPGGMGGKETAKEILQLQPAARIIVASGYSNDPVMSNYQSYGFTAALSKPFTSQEVFHHNQTAAKDAGTSVYKPILTTNSRLSKNEQFNSIKYVKPIAISTSTTFLKLIFL